MKLSELAYQAADKACDAAAAALPITAFYAMANGPYFLMATIRCYFFSENAKQSAVLNILMPATLTASGLGTVAGGLGSSGPGLPGLVGSSLSLAAASMTPMFKNSIRNQDSIGSVLATSMVSIVGLFAGEMIYARYKGNVSRP